MARLIAPLCLVGVVVLGGCHLVNGIETCADGEACPDGTACNTALGICKVPEAPPVDGEGEGEGEEGEGEEGEGEEGEGEAPPINGEEGEGEGFIGGEGEGEGEGEGPTITPLATACGDGVASSGEDCDDGNRVSGDDCSSTCRVDTQIDEVEPNDGPDFNGLRDLDVEHAVVGGEIEMACCDPNGNPVSELDANRLHVDVPSVVRLELFDRADADDCTGTRESVIELFDQNINFLNSGYANGSCSVMTAFLQPASYDVLAFEESGQLTIPSYRLQVAPLEDRGVESLNNDTPALAERATLLGLDVTMAGAVGTADDVDVYAVNVPSGRGLRAEVIPEQVALDCANFNAQIALVDELGDVITSRTGASEACPYLDGTGAVPRNDDAKNTALQARVMFVAVSKGPAGFTNALPYRLAITVR